MTRQLLPDPEIQALIRKLNAAAGKTAGDAAEAPATATPEADHSAPPPPVRHGRWTLPERSAAAEEGEERLQGLLEHARHVHASDLLLVVGTPPMVRVHGRLGPVGKRSLTAGEAALIAAALVPPSRRSTATSLGYVDFSFARSGLGRFRCNVHRERDNWSAAIRLFPLDAPDLATLNLPQSLERFCALEHGLVLVTGPTGSGKSTTLAALVRGILARRRVHLITIEDPVEYEHEHGESVVEHVEIGRDVESFNPALRAALRQDPDVLLVGEMRDPESISMAITAAETGHLVLSTLHTGDGPQTIHRILDSYPANQMDAVRVQLSISLAGVVSQTLLPRSDGKGRVPAVEVLVATPAVRNLIRQNKIPLLRSQITLEQQAGMLSLDQSLARLVNTGMTAESDARARARVPGEFESALRTGT